MRAVGRYKEISEGRCELASRKKAPLFSPRASLLFGRGDICWNNIDIRSFARLFSSLSINKILLSVSFVEVIISLINLQNMQTRIKTYEHSDYFSQISNVGALKGLKIDLHLSSTNSIAVSRSTMTK